MMAFFPRFKPNGPQLPAGHRAVRPDYDLELFEEIYEALLQAETEDDGLQQIRHIISNKAVTWEVVLTTLQALIDEATPGDTAVLTIGAPAYFAILRQLMCAERWPFLRSAEHVHRALASQFGDFGGILPNWKRRAIDPQSLLRLLFAGLAGSDTSYTPFQDAEGSVTSSTSSTR